MSTIARSQMHASTLQYDTDVETSFVEVEQVRNRRNAPKLEMPPPSAVSKPAEGAFTITCEL